MLTVGSLFSGIGGMDLGLERAGWEVKWQIENNDYCNRVLEKHWPDVRRYGDIRTVDPAGLEPVDLICGGFPCQDLSVAGKRAGLAGKRSGLFFEYIRMVRALRPASVLIENVPGLRSSHEGADMAIVIEALSELGHGVAWRSLDSQYFGVAQARERVFFIGYLGSPCPPEILFESESVYGDTPKGSRTRSDIAGTVAEGFRSNSNDGSHIVSHPLLAKLNMSLDPSMETYVVRLAQTSSNGWGISEDMTHTLDETGGDAILSYRQEWAQNGGAGVSGLVVTSRVRRLTPLECERLQGFPDGWTNFGKDAPRYKALGNAVTVPVAEWIGRRLLESQPPADRREGAQS